MSYINFNPNPDKKNIGDCVVRAICAATDCDWESSYIKIVLRGFILHDMPSSDDVWGAQLYSEGFTREVVPNSCPYCYTIKDFCEEHPEGVYVIGTGTHAVCVKNGDYYDAWDSGDKVPLLYWRKER